MKIKWFQQIARRKRKNKLTGSVLAFTTFILIAITILVSTILLQSGIVVYYQAQVIKTFNINTDISTSINYLLYDINLQNGNVPELSSILNDNQNPVTVFKSRWGFLNVIGAYKQFRNNQYSSMAFPGYSISKSKNICLYIVDEGTPLSLCGSTEIKGDVYLPRKGVKRGNLGNNPYQSDNLIDGMVNISESTMPAIYYSTLDSVINYFNIIVSADLHSFISLGTGEEGQVNPFNSSAKIIYNESTIILSNVNFKGKFLFESETSISIDSSARLEDVIIKAPYIEIGDNFKGSVQCIASDSIYIGENCSFQYPSVISLITQNEAKSFKSVIISESSIVNGLVFIAPDNMNNNSTLLTLNEGATIIGQLYCNGIFEAKGTVVGSTVCRNTILFTPSSVHGNYLLNTKLSSNNNYHYLNILPGIFEDGKKNILKWL